MASDQFFSSPQVGAKEAFFSGKYRNTSVRKDAGEALILA